MLFSGGRKVSWGQLKENNKKNEEKETVEASNQHGLRGGDIDGSDDDYLIDGLSTSNTTTSSSSKEEEEEEEISSEDLEELEEVVVEESGGVKEVKVRMSILEVYNDSLRDLLSPVPDDTRLA